MKSFLADSNIFLRLFVQDNPVQTKESLKYLEDAKKGKIKILILSEIIPEIEYVLRKVYKRDKVEIVKDLNVICSTSYLDLQQKSIWLKSLKIYKNNNIDLIDAFLYQNKLEKNMKILSFDKDFKKIKS